jgi:hypothetical protein
MSGRVAALWQAAITLPWILSFFVAGHLSDFLESQSADHAAHILFLVGAIVLAAICAYGFWRPRAVFDHVVAERAPRRLKDDLARLLQHKPVYPALAIWLFWNFAPGAQTPLQYYVQNELPQTASGASSTLLFRPHSFRPSYSMPSSAVVSLFGSCFFGRRSLRWRS